MSKKKQTKPAQRSFLLIGFVPISPTGPTLGTPVFRQPDDTAEYIQFSTKEKKIESLIKLPKRVSRRQPFTRIGPNETFEPSHDFIIGFTDAKGHSSVYSKPELIEKFSREFSSYHPHPFLQWNLIGCFYLTELISQMTDSNIDKIFETYVGKLEQRRDHDEYRVVIHSLTDAFVNLRRTSDVWRMFYPTFGKKGVS